MFSIVKLGISSMNNCFQLLYFLISHIPCIRAYLRFRYNIERFEEREDLRMNSIFDIIHELYFL